MSLSKEFENFTISEVRTSDNRASEKSINPSVRKRSSSDSTVRRSNRNIVLTKEEEELYNRINDQRNREFVTFSIKLDGKNNYSIVYHGYYYTVVIEGTTYIVDIDWGKGTILGTCINGVVQKLTDEHRYKMMSMGIKYV